MRIGRRCAGILALVLAVLSTMIAPLAAQEATPAAAMTIVPPDEEVGDLSLGEWSARWWQWLMSFPTDVNPGFDETGARCGYGQSGPVFFLVGSNTSVERTC